MATVGATPPRTPNGRQARCSMALRPSPEAQSDPGSDSIITRAAADNPPRSPPKVSQAQQFELQFFAIVDRYRGQPPERALWREAVELVITTALRGALFFECGSRRVSGSLVVLVALGLYYFADRAGIIQHSQHDLATRLRVDRSTLSRIITVLKDVGLLRAIRLSRRTPERLAMNIGGLSWTTACQQARERRLLSRATNLQRDLGAPSCGLGPLLKPLSGGPRPQPYGLHTYSGVAVAVATVPDVSKEIPTKGTQQQLHQNDEPTTTPIAAPRVAGTAAGTKYTTTDTTSVATTDADERRIEGLIGAIAARTRQTGGRFGPDDEDLVRSLIAAGQLSLGDLQRRADELETRPIRHRRRRPLPDEAQGRIRNCPACRTHERGHECHCAEGESRREELFGRPRGNEYGRVKRHSKLSPWRHRKLTPEETAYIDRQR